MFYKVEGGGRKGGRGGGGGEVIGGVICIGYTMTWGLVWDLQNREPKA